KPKPTFHGCAFWQKTRGRPRAEPRLPQEQVKSRSTKLRFGKAKRQEWKTQQPRKILKRSSSGPTEPCRKRSGGCRIFPAFKWLTSRRQRCSRRYQAKRNGVMELNCWGCTAARSERNSHSTL